MHHRTLIGGTLFIAVLLLSSVFVFDDRKSVALESLKNPSHSRTMHVPAQQQLKSALYKSILKPCIIVPFCSVLMLFTILMTIYIVTVVDSPVQEKQLEPEKVLNVVDIEVVQDEEPEPLYRYISFTALLIIFIFTMVAILYYNFRPVRNLLHLNYIADMDSEKQCAIQPFCAAHWETDNELGHGVHSTVYMIHRRDFPLKPFAMKVFTEEQVYQRELYFLDSIPYHKNIIGRPIYAGNKTIIMEYCKHGTIARMLSADYIPDMTYLAFIAKQVLSAIDHLHNRFNAMHNDIKPDNLGVYENADGSIEIKLIDFSSASLLSEASGRVGTCKYMAPEVLLNDGETIYDSRADVFSLGMVLVDILSKGKMGREYSTQEWEELMRSSEGSFPFQKFISRDILEDEEDLNNFLTLALSMEPKNRPFAGDLLSHTFLTIADGTGFVQGLESVGFCRRFH